MAKERENINGMAKMCIRDSITGSRSDLSGLVHGGIAALCERRPGMKFIIEPSAASGMIRLPLKKEMKVPSLWEIMVSKYFSVKIYKY